MLVALFHFSGCGVGAAFALLLVYESYQDVELIGGIFLRQGESVDAVGKDDLGREQLLVLALEELLRAQLVSSKLLEDVLDPIDPAAAVVSIVFGHILSGSLRIAAHTTLIEDTANPFPRIQVRFADHGR
jgi:hypothetical protein